MAGVTPVVVDNRSKTGIMQVSELTKAQISLLKFMGEHPFSTLEVVIKDGQPVFVEVVSEKTKLD